MRVRIATVKQRRSGESSRRDAVVEVEVLALGRRPASDLLVADLSIELDHSRIHRTPDGVEIEAVDAANVTVNGRARPSHLLSPGDVVAVGPFEVRVLSPTGDEDLSLEVEQVGAPQEAKTAASRAGLGPFSQRALAWTLGVGVVAVLLVVPLVSGVLWPWDTGPLSRAHHFIGDDCGLCHAVGFKRVQDEQCLACHARIGAHSPAAITPVELDETRCGQCHMEHNGLLGLAQLEQQLCADCHAALDHMAPDTLVRNASDFGRDHPEFRLSLLRADAEGELVTEREVMGPGLREESGLKFNHALHVGRPETADAPGAGFVDCSICHSLDNQGKNMLAVSFEETCQRCHSLSFEIGEEREAFHGDPVEMRADLLGFYAERELRAVEPSLSPRGLRRRGFGQTASPGRREAARAAAVEKVAAAEAFLMDPNRPGPCYQCHVVQPFAASDGGHDLAPVHVAVVWMPKSDFMHASHDPFPCRDCHPTASVFSAEHREDQERPEWSRWSEDENRQFALYSDAELADMGLAPSVTSEDVLIPELARCQTCHAGARARAPHVPSDCVLCHPFHRAGEHGRMRQARAVHPFPTTAKAFE